MKVLGWFLTFFIRLPLWFYLIYSILKLLNPDRLVWFLFCVYVVAGFIDTVVTLIVMIQDLKKIGALTKAS